MVAQSMPPCLAFIHTSHVLIPTFATLAKNELPGIKIFHMVDESLIQNTIAANTLTKTTIRRLVDMIGSAHDGGADAVMVTCSSIGEAIPIARRVYDFPVFRVDEAMAEKAVQDATRIGVAATLQTTLQPTVALLEEKAQARGRPIEILGHLCEGAFQSVLSGDTDRHDRLVSSALLELAKRVDAIVLAQASMARVVNTLPRDAIRIPVLSSPDLAVRRARDVLLHQ
jgi:Asp/Glu/hydantoin racemase